MTGFNVTQWLTHRPQAALGAVGRLLGWIADGTVTGPRTTSLPLAEAARVLIRLDRGETIGKTVLVP